jgi:ribosome assembly protein YihI (activator of Der GTPase)
MSSRLKNLKKFKDILDTIIETLENDDTQNSDIIEYVCKSVDSFYSEIKQIIIKRKQDRNKEENINFNNSQFDISKINIYKSENKHIQNLNNFTNNIYYY